MSEFQMTVPDGSFLLATALPSYQDIASLVFQFRPQDRRRNQATLEEMLKNISSNGTIADWDAKSTQSFLMMSFSLARDSLLNQVKPGLPVADELILILRQRSSWLCGLALHHPHIDSNAKLQGVGLYLMTSLYTGLSISDPEGLSDHVAKATEPFGLPTEDLTDQVKYQLVSFLANRLFIIPEPAFSTQLAQDWTRYLMTRPKFSKLVTWVANRLQVEVTKDGTKPSVKSSVLPLPSADAAVSMPQIWPIPTLIEENNFAAEYARLLVALRDTTSLSERTHSQITQLNSRSDNETTGRYLQFAFRDLWNSYWKQGNHDALRLAEDVALFLLSLNRRGKLDTRKGQILHLWMNTQLPKLIYTCDLEDLVKDANELARYLKEQPNLAILLSGIIQAHAGESDSLARSNDLERKNALFRDNLTALGNIHKRYKELVGNNDRDEELSAWEILFGSGSSLTSSSPEGSSRSSTLSSIPTTVIQTILDDAAFRDIMRQGSHEQTRIFVSNKLEDILKLLRNRLDVRIGSEFVMLPEGEVFQHGSAQRKQLHPDFLAAKTALDQGNYDGAQRIFERLTSRVSGTGADIARNYLAYALAKLGEPVSARVELRRLYDSKSTYASVYWNYACCLPAEELDKKLEAFFAGLERAPHPKLLHAAIYLASLTSDPGDSNHARLGEWLPVMTHIEALLWLYVLEFDQLDFDRRDAMFLRLGQYVRKGEPAIPNPLDREILGDRLADLLPTLLERNQPKAVEFWLRCRERVARDRFDYWELRTDFLDRTGKKKEAAESFAEELRRRLTFLSHRSKNHFPVPRSVIASTSRRVDHWLHLCMTDELKVFGQYIFDDVDQFEQTIGERILLMPRDRRVREFFKQTPPFEGPGAHGVTLQGNQLPQVQAIGSQPPPSENLDSLLARVGGTCKARLHELRHLELVRRDLVRLIQALQIQNAGLSSTSLSNLINEWERDWPHMSREDREQALDSAKALFSEFRSNLQRELSPNLNEIALPLFEALNRLNDHLARTASLLPRLIAATIDGQPAPVDPTTGRTAFPVRLSCQAGDPPARVKNVEATLADDLIPLTLRDRPADLDLIVSPEHSLIMTFELVPNVDLTEPRQVRLVVTYEYAGSDYVAESLYISIQSRECPPLPKSSPYVYGRPLQTNEIEPLFVGRDEEQQAVLMSISNGQQVVRYLEGIRRVGKSSLLRAIEYKIRKLGLPIIPVQVAPDSITDPGLVLYNLLKQIVNNPEIAAYGVNSPNEAQCRSNPTATYEDFQLELRQKIPDRRVVALLDDFQELVNAASSVREKDPALAVTFRSILNKIRQLANPDARLLWVFAGQMAREQYRRLLPNVLFWGDMISLLIAFLDRDSIGEILKRPLASTPMIVPDETVERLHYLTAGHPESAQQMAEFMLKKAVAEKRQAITPADADEAAWNLAETQDTFADTWYPHTELTQIQKSFMAAFIQAVPAGRRIEPYRLIPGGNLSDAQKNAIDDLVARNILEPGHEGQYGVKAYVLDLWLRRFLRRVGGGSDLNGSVAIFVDVANLTNGTGAAVLSNLVTQGGEGMPGRFSLKTVLNVINSYATSLSPIPIAARYTVNYPTKSAAVLECSALGYYIEPIPEYLWEKGTDDHVLINKISDVEQLYPMVSHYVLVTGDRDYRIKVNHLLEKGKYVYVISRAQSLSRPEAQDSYDFLAAQYPERFKVIRLEELLERVA